MSRLAARRRETNIKVGHERWLVSYSDFVTLLFAFFVVMYSISQVNESKYKSLSETLSAAFTKQAPSASETSAAEPIEALADIQSLTTAIERELRGFPVQGQVSLGANENWVELTLNSELLFDSGSAEPSAEAQQVFSDLADLLAPYDNEIQIVGHTDNVPINNARFENNWSLSSARAVSIVDLLSFQGVNPDQMSAVAFGEHRPIADNNTEEGRNKNRRVVVRISDQAVPAEKQAPEFLFGSEPSANETSVDVLADATETETESIAPELPSDTPGSLNRTEGVIKPVRLKGGDLLFTSDPNLPRNREIETDDQAE